ncbi:GNAT family N-acetyltransferase [Anaerosporobacter faecicola]|uniref:GNAT family N-acetyltransferase n=1 Tax=Anaerosporobacter faecicola TaxID=2718714 RepID=UPI001439657C|nr:GNAT family N-acetyltransferase [Anaerosporobacter faecicola]
MQLYTDVGWINYTSDPGKLERAYQNSLSVITAWDQEKLVGAIRVVGDGVTILYVQDLLVATTYQGQGIGTELFQRIMNKYKHVTQKVLLTDAEPKTKEFYTKMGWSMSDTYQCVSYVNFSC